MCLLAYAGCYSIITRPLLDISCSVSIDTLHDLSEAISLLPARTVRSDKLGDEEPVGVSVTPLFRVYFHLDGFVDHWRFSAEVQISELPV